MANNYKKKRKPIKKGFSKNTRKFNDTDKFDYEGSSKQETNDPSWYAQYPELMQDSASIPYSIPTGSFARINFVDDPSMPVPTQGLLPVTAYQSVPGIMTLGVIPTVGVAIDATSPVNVAMEMLYTKVRAENSGSRNYDAPDLMIYCLGMDQIYSLLTWYNRIYGTLMLYAQNNRYLPEAMLEAQLIDFSDLILHINDFKAFLDTATAQAAVFSVPNDMKLFNRHAFMYQNVYRDADTVKGQLYQFAPRLFYKFDEFNGAGRLVAIDLFQRFGTTHATFNDLVNLFHEIMNPMIRSEDFNIMSGDILKAFGAGNLIKLQIMPQGYTIMPVVDYEVLTQIKNASMSYIMAGLAGQILANPNDWAIHQDSNNEFIEWNPIIHSQNTPHYNYVKDRFLSTYKTSPEPADNMVYTRLMYVLNDEEDTSATPTTYNFRFDSVGSEFVTRVYVTVFHTDGNGNWTYEGYGVDTVSENSTNMNSSGNFQAVLVQLWMLKHFDFAPCAYYFARYGTSPNLTAFYPFFDMDNWTIVHAYELEKMHRTALMSMLRVPMIGSALPSVRSR